MIDHLTIDHGRIVDETPRHLRLVVSNDWPDENDTDQHYADDGNPLAVAFCCILLVAFLGFTMWAAT